MKSDLYRTSKCWGWVFAAQTWNMPSFPHLPPQLSPALEGVNGAIHTTETERIPKVIKNSQYVMIPPAVLTTMLTMKKPYPTCANWHPFYCILLFILPWSLKSVAKLPLDLVAIRFLQSCLRAWTYIDIFQTLHYIFHHHPLFTLSVLLSLCVLFNVLI